MRQRDGDNRSRPGKIGGQIKGIGRTKGGRQLQESSLSREILERYWVILNFVITIGT